MNVGSEGIVAVMVVVVEEEGGGVVDIFFWSWNGRWKVSHRFLSRSAPPIENWSGAIERERESFFTTTPSNHTKCSSCPAVYRLSAPPH